MENGTSHKTNGHSTTPWRIYLFGAGAIACHHALAAQSLGNIEIFAADPSKDARKTFITKFPQATVYDNAEIMLASSPGRDHDIVIAAVPPWLHHSATISGFKSKRHVLCEKPVARSETELAEMLAASRGAGRIFAECSYRYLGNGAIDRARQLLEAGSIGTPYHARLVYRAPRARPGIEYQPESKWFLDKSKAGGGVIFDWAGYDFTMLFEVLRPIAVTVHSAWVATPKTGADPSTFPISVETHAGASMTLKLESGPTVAFDYERACGFHGEPQESLSIDGETGGLTWEWMPTYDDISELAEGERRFFKLTQFVDVEGKVEAKVENFPGFSWNDANARPLLSLVDLIEGRESVVLSPAKSEFHFGIISAIYKSAAEKVAVNVELKQ